MPFDQIHTQLEREDTETVHHDAHSISLLLMPFFFGGGGGGVEVMVVNLCWLQCLFFVCLFVFVVVVVCFLWGWVLLFGLFVCMLQLGEIASLICNGRFCAIAHTLV